MIKRVVGRIRKVKGVINELKKFCAVVLTLTLSITTCIPSFAESKVGSNGGGGSKHTVTGTGTVDVNSAWQGY